MITLTRPSESKEHRTIHGTTRALLANMVNWCYLKDLHVDLNLVGVGYRAQLQGT